MRLEPLPGSLDLEPLRRAAYTGWTGPRTLEQCLKAASDAMDREDAPELAYRAWLAGGPVRGMRHPRRKLRALLRRG